MLKAEMGIFIITSICTLRCKKCITLTPYQKNQHHTSFKVIKKSIQEFFKVYDYIEHADLEGGETLLHPQLKEIIQEFYKYQSQFGELRILTNGTVVPDDDMLDFLGELKNLFVIVDDYGELSNNITSLLEEMEKRNIRYRVDRYTGDAQYCGGWVDMSDLSECINPSAKERQQVLANCRQGNYIPNGMKPCIHDGMLCLCMAQAALLPHIPMKKGEYVNLLDDTVSLEEKIKTASAFGKNPIETCAYCRGFDVVNGIRVPAAEQISAE